MDLDELLTALPNGLHDAEVRRLVIDYEARTLELVADLWMAEELWVTPELYRAATIRFDGLEYCVLQAPDPTYSYDLGEPLCVDGWPATTEETSTPGPRAEGAFLCRLFVQEWNAFAIVCARSVALTWLGEPFDRDV